MASVHSTPFEPAATWTAELPISIAVVLVAAPAFASVVKRGISAAMVGHVQVLLVWAVALAAAVLLALAATNAVRARYGRALAALGAATLVLSFALNADAGPRDALLVGGMLAAPVCILLVLVTAPLVLAARLGAREPDAREHFATAGAVWLLLAGCALDAPYREIAVVAAALLAAFSFHRDLWRATWLRRVRHGAIAGVRLVRSFPCAAERLEVVMSEGAGPFRRALRIDSSEIVRVEWLRLGVSLAVVLAAAAYAVV